MKAMASKKMHVLKKAALVWIFIGIGGCAQTGSSYFVSESGTAAERVAEHYPEGGFQSVEVADQALVEVRAERAANRVHFLEQKRACYERFFVNRCLDEVSERERLAEDLLHQVEIEANAFKRRNKVERRDERARQKEDRRLHIPVEAVPPQPNGAKQ